MRLAKKEGKKKASVSGLNIATLRARLPDSDRAHRSKTQGTPNSLPPCVQEGWHKGLQKEIGQGQCRAPRVHRSRPDYRQPRTIVALRHDGKDETLEDVVQIFKPQAGDQHGHLNGEKACGRTRECRLSVLKRTTPESKASPGRTHLSLPGAPF